MRLVHRLETAVAVCVFSASFVACSGSSNSGGSTGSRADAGSGGSGGEDDAANASGGDTASSGTGGSGPSSTGSGNGNTTTGSGGDTSGSGSSNTTVGLVSGDPIPIEDYSAAVGQAFCPAVTPCCAEMFDLTVDNASCVSTIGTSFTEDYESADPDNYSYDADLAGDCVATAEQVYGSLNCDFDGADSALLDQLDAACDGVFTGVLAPGEPCNSSIECAAAAGQDAGCDDVNFDDNYVCTVEYRASLGEACYWSCSEDGVVTSCNGAGNSSETAALRGECYTNDGLFCGSEGVCEELAGLGEPCGSDSNCAAGFCDSGECAAPLGQGMTCVTDSWCAEALYCADQSCAPKLALGETCALSSECLSGFCTDDVCGDESAAGDLGLAFVCGLISGEL